MMNKFSRLFFFSMISIYLIMEVYLRILRGYPVECWETDEKDTKYKMSLIYLLVVYSSLTVFGFKVM